VGRNRRYRSLVVYLRTMAIGERALRRLSSKLPLRRHDTTAFVFSGGGVFGAMQVGQLTALVERGITPDLIVGTSIGAINGAAFASDPTLAGLDRLKETWLSMRGPDIFPGGAMSRAARALRRGDYVLENRGLRRVVDRIRARTFEQLHTPFHAVTTRLSTGEERVFSSGPLAPALLASAALPGVFAPIAIDGERYTDGGVVNNTPISVAVAQGATRIYVLTCGRTNLAARDARRPLDVMVQAFAHSRARRFEHDLERYSSQAHIEVLPVSDPPTLRYDDLTHTAELMDRCESEARSYLAHPSRARMRA
jgi:NTE family protein